jgi:hypothetical protein
MIDADIRKTAPSAAWYSTVLIGAAATSSAPSTWWQSASPHKSLEQSAAAGEAADVVAHVVGNHGRFRGSSGILIPRPCRPGQPTSLGEAAAAESQRSKSATSQRQADQRISPEQVGQFVLVGK